MRLSILIPAYNEQDTIQTVIRRICTFDWSKLGCEVEIVVCDDGSTDATASQVQRLQVEYQEIVLTAHAHNIGKGAAIRTALERATGEYTLIQDADLEYGTDAYAQMVEAVRHGAQVVYASRFLSQPWPAGMHPANFVANKLLTVVANSLFHLNITDEATALKLFSTSLLESLRLTCVGFEFCPEVTAKLGLKGIPIHEVPVDYKARKRQHGKKVRWTDGVMAVAMLLRQRLSSRARLAPPVIVLAADRSRTTNAVAEQRVSDTSKSIVRQ